MNIAFDSYALLGPMSKGRGIGNYTFSQFTGMINKDKNNKYFFLNLIDRDYHLADHLENTDNFSETFIDTGKNNLLIRKDSYADVIGDVIKRFIRDNDIDVFYITSPFEGDFFYYKKEWFKDIKVVATVYDIIPYVMKEVYLSDKDAYDRYVARIEELKWLDKIYVISQSVKDDLIRCFDFPDEQIEVIWGAPSDIYREIEISNAEKKELYQKYSVSEPFIMCTGGDDVRKNINGLVSSYHLLPQDIKEKYHLVVICKLTEGRKKELAELAAGLGESERIVFTGFVSDEELIEFYNLASLMVFPSKYEGFGLPITEAWACGTPVVTADNSSLIEVGGDAAIMVNAHDNNSIAEGMKKILSDEAMLKEYTEKGKERLKLFSWDHICELVIEKLEKIEINRKENNSDQKINIAFFTSLPPIQSGIADYSEDIVKELCKYCDIDVYIDDYEVTGNYPENVNILNHRDFEANRHKYKETVYQMGNSDYHYYMYPYIRKYGGVLVLHDYNMHAAFHNESVSNNAVNAEKYADYVFEDYPGDMEYVRFTATGKAPNLMGRELNGYITNYADRIIVHSEESKRKLLEKDISKKVKIIPSYAIINPLVDGGEIKKKYGFDPENIIIAAFGSIHPTKRSVPLLKAFVNIHKQYSQTRLVFVGKIFEEIKDEFDKLLEKNNMEDVVRVTGYVDIEDFKQYIDMTDICINLRYPSNGETSGSLMRILSRGKCVVINDIGTFAEFPDEICEKLPSVDKMNDKDEEDYIADALKKLLSDNAYMQNKGKMARIFAEEKLDIKKIAKQYYDYIVGTSYGESVTNELIAALRNDPKLDADDISGVAETIAYAKG